MQANRKYNEGYIKTELAPRQWQSMNIVILDHLLRATLPEYHLLSSHSSAQLILEILVKS